MPYVQNESSISKVESRFLPLIDEVKDAYIKYFSSSLIAIYLEGSVGRGNFVDGVSDCDFDAVIDREVTKDDWAYLKSASESISSNYQWLPKLDMEVVDKANLPKQPIKQFIMVTDGLLIHGELDSLRHDYPAIGPDLAQFLNNNFLHLLKRAELVTTNHNNESLYLANRTRWLVKVMLRLSLGIAMTKQPQYTHEISQITPLLEATFPDLSEITRPLNDIRLHPEGTLKQYQLLLSNTHKLYAKAQELGIAE